MKPCAEGERGIALVLVVFALFVLGTLASTAFLLSFGEVRVGRTLIRHHQAASAADAGAYAPAARWDAQTYNRLPLGDSINYSGGTAAATGFYEGSITRLGPNLFLARSSGFGPSGGFAQRSAALYRLHPIELEPIAALDIRGPLSLGESVRVVGHDNPPRGWSCPPDSGGVPALRTPGPDSSAVPWIGCDVNRCLVGDPRFVSTLPSAGLTGMEIDRGTLEDLKSVAAHVISGGNFRIQAEEANGTCVTASPTNWGDPFDQGGACGDYRPGVYSEGDLLVRAGQGQGVLVVEGDFTVSGNFQYFGVVIVLGRLMSIGAGSQITGAVVVANEDLDPQSLAGMTRFQYSRCAVNMSLTGSGRGVLLRERSWLDMY